jgi:hypothetical protein
MGRLAFAVLLLLLEIVCRAHSASNVDPVVEGKASLVSGAVPASQLESGVANASTCLKGNSTSGSCGGGSPAGISYANTAQNWSQALSTAVTGCPTGISCTTQTITLPSGITGIDVSTGLYQIYISDGANSEAVAITGGTYTSGAGGTLTFVPYFSHTSYTVESASSGIQETINVACGTVTNASENNGQCNVIIPANGGPAGVSYQPTNDHPLNNYQIYGTIFMHAFQSVLSGYGVSVNCLERNACLQMGDLSNANHYSDMTVNGIHFRAPVISTSDPAYAGVNVTTTVRASQITTITTGSAHGFRPGDMVTILFTDDSHYWGDAVVTTVPTATTFTYSHSGPDVASQTTPGVVALAYVAVLDNANSGHFIDVGMDYSYGEARAFNNFFDMWDDENAVIDHFNNSSVSLNHNANWTGSYVFSAGNQGAHPIAPVITLRDSNITANYSNGVTDYNSNGLYVENTVIQAQGLWQVYASNTTGNFQGAYLKNIYAEAAGLNPLSPAASPFPGTGNAGLIVGPATANATFQIAGDHAVEGTLPSGGTGSTTYYYYIVAHDTTVGTQTSPMAILGWNSTGSDSIPVRWPRVANGADTITYDVLRTGGTNPYGGGCLGGSGATCGSVATGLSQSTACSGTLVCTYTDTGSSTTSAYTSIYGNYGGQINFWPAAIVSVNKTISVDTEQYGIGIGLNGNPLENAKLCDVGGSASAGSYNVCLSSVTSQNVKNQTATLLTDGPASGGGMTLSKGRLNFPELGTLQPHHIITLIDSAPLLTESTLGYRPLASVNDTWIGTDVTSSGTTLSSGQLAFGAPVSITNYIRATGDGVHTNWLERLTSKQKTFAIPVRISEGNSFTLGDGSPLSQMKIYSVNNMPASHVPPQSCVDVVGEAKGLTKSNQIASITPPGRLGNLSLNAYPADEGAIILHFCNASGSEAVTPPGAYSFLAVR